MSKLSCPSFTSGTDPGPRVDGTSLAITIIVTFVVTALAAGFLGVVVGLVLYSYSNKRKQKKTISKGHWSSHATEEKSNL